MSSVSKCFAKTILLWCEEMLLKNSLTSGLTNKSEQLTVQKMTDILITVNYRKWTSLAKRLMSNDNAQHNVAFACCCCYRQECSCSASWYWIDWRSPAEHPRQCRCRGLPYPKRECVIIPRYCWALWQYARGRAASDTKATPQSESQRATLSKQGCYLAGDRKDATLTKQECYKQTLKCSIVYCICNTLILWQTLANCITSMILLLSAQIQKVL